MQCTIIQRIAQTMFFKPKALFFQYHVLKPEVEHIEPYTSATVGAQPEAMASKGKEMIVYRYAQTAEFASVGQ